MKKAIVVIVIVVILGGGAFALVKHNDDKDNGKPAASTSEKTGTSSSTDSSKASQTSGVTASGTEFTINANDDTADIKTLNVKKGDTVKVTFKVDTSGVYYGGLEFKSDVVSTKPLKPGESETVTFTADKSFDFTPYWYQSQVKKDYVISVKVQ